MDFRYDMLKIITGEDDEAVMTHLERAVKAGLVRETRVMNQIWFVFIDEQIRDFLYNELSLIRKRKTHTQIGEALELLYQQEKEHHLNELAYHYVQAADSEKAARYSLMAGDHATELHASSEAKHHYQNVLDLLDDKKLDERLNIIEKLGDTCRRVGEYEGSERYYNDAINIARKLGETRKIASIHRKLGYVNWFWTFGGTKQASLAHYKEALQAIEGEKDTPEEAEICQDIARLLVNTGETDDGLQWCQRAITISRKVGAHDALANSLQTLALGVRPGREGWPRIFNYLEESLTLCLHHGLEEAACRAYTNLGSAYFFRFDYGRAKRIYEDGVAYARKTGLPAPEAFLDAWLALHAYIPLGEWSAALEAATNGFRISSEFGDFYVGVSLVALGRVELLQGNLDQAERHLHRGYSLVSDYREAVYPCCLGLGLLYDRQNYSSKAVEYLQKAAQAGSEFALSSPPLEAYFELAHLYNKAGDFKELETCYENTKRASDQFDEEGVHAFESYLHGLLASGMDNLDVAKSAFMKSTKIWHKINHPYYHARSQAKLAETLSRIGEKTEAATCLKEARSTFTRLGARTELAQLDRNLNLEIGVK